MASHALQMSISTRKRIKVDYTVAKIYYACAHVKAGRQKERNQNLFQKLRDLSVRGGPCGLLRVHVCIRNMLAIAAKRQNDHNNQSKMHRKNSMSFAGQSSSLPWGMLTSLVFCDLCSLCVFSSTRLSL